MRQFGRRSPTGAADGASNVQGIAIATGAVTERANIATPSAWSPRPNQVRIARVRTIFVILQAATGESPTSYDYGSPGAPKVERLLAPVVVGVETHARVIVRASNGWRTGCDRNKGEGNGDGAEHLCHGNNSFLTSTDHSVAYAT